VWNPVKDAVTIKRALKLDNNRHNVMHNSITHYQTSFRVSDHEDDGMMRVKSAVYGWIANKESDYLVKNDKNRFFVRCNWQNLYKSRSDVATMSFRSDTGDAWAMRYTEIDKERRSWISDIGLKKDGPTIIVSVRVSYAWNDEDLGYDRKNPDPSVPRVVRYILKDNHVFSGRPEFELLEVPIPFLKPGRGKSLCDFIQSPERQYPLSVFNDDSPTHVAEASKLARELTGKCLVSFRHRSRRTVPDLDHCPPSDPVIRENRPSLRRSRLSCHFW
jgi:hypothetical protein